MVIGESADTADDDLTDSREEISTSPAAAMQWCVEPTRGMGPLLECGAVRIVGIDLSAEEKSAGLVRVTWTVTINVSRTLLAVNSESAASSTSKPTTHAWQIWPASSRSPPTSWAISSNARVTEPGSATRTDPNHAGFHRAVSWQPAPVSAGSVAKRSATRM